jgi:hypothetical protein
MTSVDRASVDPTEAFSCGEPGERRVDRDRQAESQSFMLAIFGEEPDATSETSGGTGSCHVDEARTVHKCEAKAT